MSHGSPARLTIVGPGEGRAGQLGPGLGVVLKIWGEETGGSLSIVEHPFAVGVLVPPHVHSREDEISIVLEGEIGFRSGDHEAVLGAGGYIVKPRGELHAMWNAGTTPARMIEIITPAGFERFFRDVVDALESDVPNVDGAALSAEYGLTFAEPDWLSDVIARYGLKLEA
jgi:quercetin dioxygenase-like cupin family protein